MGDYFISSSWSTLQYLSKVTDELLADLRIKPSSHGFILGFNISVLFCIYAISCLLKILLTSTEIELGLYGNTISYSFILYIEQILLL